MNLIFAVGDLQAMASDPHQPDLERMPGLRKTIMKLTIEWMLLLQVEPLLNDPSKARKKLGWTSRISFEALLQEMVSQDLDTARRDKLCADAGFSVEIEFTREGEIRGDFLRVLLKVFVGGIVLSWISEIRGRQKTMIREIIRPKTNQIVM